MKSSRKAIPFVFISLLCGISVAGLFLPLSPWLNATHLLFFEFPPFSLSVLITTTCILFAGMFFGAIARKYAAQVKSKFQLSLANTGIFINAIILILPVLNLISIFTPRTITGVVDFKIEGEERGYICVTEIATDNSRSQEVNFDDNTVIYERGQKVDQHDEIGSVGAIQPGQVVEIVYLDNDTSILGIKALSITLHKGQHKSYKNTNCGNLLP